MSFFSETVQAKLAGRTVRMARLVEMEFLDGTGRYWEGGAGTLLAGGYEWTGTGSMTSISGIESAFNGNAPSTTIGLSGVDGPSVARLIGSENDVKDQPIRIYIQFYDEADLAPLDEPYCVYTGLMDVMSANIKGPTNSSIQVTCESLFAGRARPPWGYLSDRSQQALFPGDEGLSEVPAMVNAQPFWPVF